MKKISIIVPIFNVEKYLDKSISNIIDQSYSNIEIILVNDGSTDNSLNICNKYKKIDDRIIVINQKNKGASAARNKGRDIATGEYILFVDSDDILNKNLIDEISVQIEQNKDVICFQHSINSSEEYTYLDIDDKLELNGEDFLELLNKKDRMFNVIWKYCYKKEFLDKNKLRFHEGIIYEDEEWVTEVLCKAKSAVFRNFNGYNYIIRDGSVMTSKKNKNSYISKIKVAISLEDFIEKNHIKNKVLLKIIKKKIYSFYVRDSIYLLKNNEIEEINLVLKNLRIIKNCSNIKQFLLGIVFVFYLFKQKILKKLKFKIVVYLCEVLNVLKVGAKSRNCNNM